MNVYALQIVYAKCTKWKFGDWIKLINEASLKWLYLYKKLKLNLFYYILFVVIAECYFYFYIYYKIY